MVGGRLDWTSESGRKSSLVQWWKLDRLDSQDYGNQLDQDWSDQACQAIGYAIFITIYYVQIKLFLSKLIVSMNYLVEIVPRLD